MKSFFIGGLLLCIIPLTDWMVPTGHIDIIGRHGLRLAVANALEDSLREPVKEDSGRLFIFDDAQPDVYGELFTLYERKMHANHTN